MRSYETRKAVLLKTYLASDIKVPILLLMRIDSDVYDLACIQLFLEPLHDPMYISCRTLTVVDIYEQYQYVHKSSRQTSQCV